MTDYGYCHARVRSMKSRMLGPEIFANLMEADDIPAVISILDKTVYGEHLRESLLRYPGISGIDEGLRLNLSDTFAKLLSFLDGEAARGVSLLLDYWDVQNIKTILRGKHVGAEYAEIIGSMVPAGVLPEETMVALAAQPDLKAVVDLMATWAIEYHRPITRNFSSYATSHSLAQIEIALEQYYFQRALSLLNDASLESKLTREIIGRQIDALNVMTLLRLANEGRAQEGAKFFIKGGGRLDQERFNALAKNNRVEEIVSGLSGTDIFQPLTEGLEAYREQHSLAALERRLEEFRIRKIVALFNAEPLSIAVIIAFLWAKINEVINIRVVARSVAKKTPAALVRRNLVLI